ncbi:MAG: hypothetical protein K5894_10860, partial [Lachnospiraceae bacterium]|nr:hypothetical protein [Lachnospiraceae bacterium]
FGIFLAIAIVFMALEIIINKFRNISYNTAYIAAMLMTTIAVAWARGGVLVVRTSDSGNRILLQCIPFIVYTMFTFCTRLCYINMRK